MSNGVLQLLTILCFLAGQDAYFHSPSHGLCNIQRQRSRSLLMCSSNEPVDEPPKRKVIRQKLPKDLPMKTAIPATGKSNSGSTVKSILMGQPIRTVRRVSPLDQLKYSLTDVGYAITNLWLQIKSFFVSIITTVQTNLQTSRMRVEERLQVARLRLLEWLREDDKDDKHHEGSDKTEKSVRDEPNISLSSNDGNGSNNEGDDEDNDGLDSPSSKRIIHSSSPISPEIERKELQRKANMEYAQRKLLEIEMLEKDNASSKEMRENRRKARDTYAERKLQEIEAMERDTKVEGRRMLNNNQPSYTVPPISPPISRTINTPINIQSIPQSESNTMESSTVLPTPTPSLNPFADESPSPVPGADPSSLSRSAVAAISTSASSSSSTSTSPSSPSSPSASSSNTGE